MTVGGPPPDGGHDGDEPLVWPVDVVVPDDISALEPDIEAWRRERRAARRAERWDRLSGHGRLRRYGISGPLAAVALLVTGTLGALLVVFSPRTGSPVSLLPPATTSVSAGAVNQALPAVVLTGLTSGSTFDQADITHPAAVVLVPSACDCAATVHQVLATASTQGLHGYVIADDVADATAAGVDAGTNATVLTESGHTLIDAYGVSPGAPTLVVLSSRALVSAIVAKVTNTTLLSSELAAALTTAAGAEVTAAP